MKAVAGTAFQMLYESVAEIEGGHPADMMARRCETTQLSSFESLQALDSSSWLSQPKWDVRNQT